MSVPPDDTHAPTGSPLEVTTFAHEPDASREIPTPPGETRPAFSAESISPSMRKLLALLTVLWAPMPPLLVLLAATPIGENVSALFVVAFFAFVAFSCVLIVVYGALVANNGVLSKTARGWWFLSLLTGPIGMLMYWRMHVLEARFVPRAHS